MSQLAIASSLFLGGLSLAVVAVTMLFGFGWGLLATAGCLVFLGLSTYVEATRSQT